VVFGSFSYLRQSFGWTALRSAGAAGERPPPCFESQRSLYGLVEPITKCDGELDHGALLRRREEIQIRAATVGDLHSSLH
jgi:hypothetical protein